MPLTIRIVFSLTSSQVIFEEKIGFYFPEITLTTEFPGRNFLLPTFLIGSKRDFQVAYMPLATVNFKPWFHLHVYHFFQERTAFMSS